MVLLKPRAWRVASRSQLLQAVVCPLLWKIHQHKGWYCADDKSGGWSAPLVFLLPSPRWRMVGQPEFGPPSGRVVNVGSSVRSPSRTERWGSRSRTGFTLASLTHYVCQEGVFGDLGRFGGLDQRACPVQAGGCGVAFFVWVGCTNAGCAGVLSALATSMPLSVVLSGNCPGVWACGRVFRCLRCLRSGSGRLWLVMFRRGVPLLCVGPIFCLGGVRYHGQVLLSTPMAYGGNFPLWYVCGHACPRTGACMPLDVALGSCR